MFIGVLMVGAVAVLGVYSVFIVFFSGWCKGFYWLFIGCLVSGHCFVYGLVIDFLLVVEWRGHWVFYWVLLCFHWSLLVLLIFHWWCSAGCMVFHCVHWFSNCWWGHGLLLMFIHFYCVYWVSLIFFKGRCIGLLLIVYCFWMSGHWCLLPFHCFLCFSDWGHWCLLVVISFFVGFILVFTYFMLVV